MYRPTQIIVPVDFSDPSRAAARRAVSIAEAFGAPMHLVHALREPLSGIYANLTVPPGMRGKIREQAGEELRKFESELPRERAEITTELVESDPVSAIQEAVERHSANLIVMGTHGDSPSRHLILGSVAERTLRSVDCPTLTVKEPLTEASKPIRRILYATDFSSHAERAGNIAIDLAKQLDARVELLHVILLPRNAIGPYGMVIAPDVAARFREEARNLLDRAAHRFEEAQVPVESHLHQGIASDLIPREAERLEADLIVMGTRGNTGLKHVFLGSVAERTLRAADCSVLTAREGDEDA